MNFFYDDGLMMKKEDVENDIKHKQVDKECNGEDDNVEEENGNDDKDCDNDNEDYNRRILRTIMRRMVGRRM